MQVFSLKKCVVAKIADKTIHFRFFFACFRGFYVHLHKKNSKFNGKYHYINS